MNKKYTMAYQLAEDVNTGMLMDFLMADYHGREKKKKEAKPYVNRKQKVAELVWERMHKDDVNRNSLKAS